MKYIIFLNLKFKKMVTSFIMSCLEIFLETMAQMWWLKQDAAKECQWPNILEDLDLENQ